MNRGTWLLAFGLSSLAGAIFAPGCSSSSGNGGTTSSSGSADGGPHDGTASGSGSGSGSSSGTDGSGSSSSADSSGSSSGADSSGSSSGDAASCPAASSVDPSIRACVSQYCCGPLTTCTNDAACVAISGCFTQCLAQHPDASGTDCAALCAADASPTGASEFQAAVACIATHCSGQPGDAGGGG